MAAKKSQFMGISVDLPETDIGTFQKGAIVSHASGPAAGAHVVHDSISLCRASPREAATPSGKTRRFRRLALRRHDGHDKKSNKVIKSQRIPASGHWGASQTLNEKQALFSGARGDLAFEVAFNGWDAVNSGSDKHLGTASGEYELRIMGHRTSFELLDGRFLATTPSRQRYPSMRPSSARKCGGASTISAPPS